MKYIVYLNGEQIGTVYAGSQSMAEEKAFRLYGLECDVEEA